ncbi:hypothetical protein [Parafrankia discariae]|uniref:hypothetical protein n=1 Tax=Parafrankia discariae TaxID=365528 RepID=UPI0003825337|nr:hypothetical protein [Parafrankia discariae]
MSELPNPVNFAAATTTVTEEDVRSRFACGPDPDGFFDFFRSTSASALRTLAPVS